MLFAIARAGSAQWDLNAGSHDWNTAANWTPMTVPNASTDTATFGLSNRTNVSVSASTEINGITFTSAPTKPYTITVGLDVRLTVSGAGITNNSGITQSFVTAGADWLFLTNSATAGSSTAFTNNGGTTLTNGFGGRTFFMDTSTPGTATITNNPARVSGGEGGTTEFFSTSAGSATIINNGATAAGANGGITIFQGGTAGNSTIINNLATVGAIGGETIFQSSSTAGNATFINNGGHTTFEIGVSAGNGTFINSNAGGTLFIGNSTAANGTFINKGEMVSGGSPGSTTFDDTSTAGAATLIANGGINGLLGGAIEFQGLSDGGTSRIELFGNSVLAMTLHSPSLTIGSIEGTGNVFLGGTNLTLGSNNLSTTFSGVIQDDSQLGGTGGSLTKIGVGALTLSGTNTYIGDTNINGGVLKVDGSITSNTFVNSNGTLAGTGTVHGNVINNGGTVAPGRLTVTGNYTQQASGTLVINITGHSPGQFSVLNVLGNANLNGALDPVLLSGFIPTIGQSFVFLNYASVSGAFSGIENQIFDNGREKWSVNYQNTDAVLTVAPNTVPEPSTLLLLTLSLLGLATYRRKSWQ